MKTKLTPIATLLTITLLTGCVKGLDRKPSFASLAAYQQSTAELKPEITDDQAIAYTYAVSGNTLESLTQKYNGQTFRQIAVSELDAYIQQNQSQLNEYEAQRQQAAPILSELSKVTVNADNVLLKKDLFNHDKLTYTVHIGNQSKLDFANVDLNAQLYLDGADKPAASETIMVDFQNQGGLKAGQSATRNMGAENFFSKSWTTLAVKNAKQRRITLELVNGTDFANNPYRDWTLEVLYDKAAEHMNDAKKYRQIVAVN